MIRFLAVLAMLFLAPFAMAAERGCMIVFDAAGFDACEQSSSGPLFDSALPGQLVIDEGSRYQVIKFDGPAPAGVLARIEQTGARVLGYLPFYAYLVEAAPALRASLAAIEGVIWAGPFQPEWKIDINLVEMVNRGDFPVAVPFEYRAASRC